MKKSLLICFLLCTGMHCLFTECIAQKTAPIKVNNSNANVYRDSLSNFIFGISGFPYGIMPDTLITNVNTFEFYNSYPYTSIKYPLGNLDSIDKLVITLGPNVQDFPAKSFCYLFHPHNSNGKLFIYLSGHCTGTAVAEDISINNNGVAPGLVIPRLLEAGYTVLTVPMISYKTVPQNGLVCGFNKHDELFSEANYSHPLSFFFKPVIASLNLLGRNNYPSIYMCGFSGGGWVAGIYPALDSSISISMPVAGTWPMAVRKAFYNGGDMEQNLPSLYERLLDYHDLYALSCLAPARKMLQVNNRFDECCFAGSSAHIYYADSVVKALKGTAAEFRFYLDETSNVHKITERTLQVMLRYIDNDKAYLQLLPSDTITTGSVWHYNIKDNFQVTGIRDNAPLKYKLLRAPRWMQLDTLTGILSGTISQGLIAVSSDSISFKVEDSSGRFVIHNFNLVKKRTKPVFFNGYEDSTLLYFLPSYSHSLQNIEQIVIRNFYFNDPSVYIHSIDVQQNSIIRMRLSRPLHVTDSIGYKGYDLPGAITFINGERLADFRVTAIQLHAVVRNHALTGMIRFNSETKKFEYFNGVVWILLN